MSKFKEIIDGWKYTIFPNETVEDMAIKRAEICASCEHNVNNKCTQCGCFLVAKTRSPKSTCPKNKWPK
mgnify:FL=1